MPTPDKDTIYIDVDDEITAIIDKVRGSDGKITALVLPKRATVFQSIVNMKLLKRAADDAKKHLVLITTETGLLPLAGVAGIHVAKTLNSKPEIPGSPTLDDGAEDAIDEDGEETVELDADDAAETPVGDLAAAGAAGAAAKPDKDGVETIELDDDVEPPENADATKKAAATGAAAAAAKKGKKDSKLKVPNFEKFRLLLILGGVGLVALIVFIIFATTVLPKATISIKTDASTVDANFDLNLSTTATTLKRSDNTIPAKLVQQQKTYTQQANATGQKNNGERARGTVNLTNCSRTEGAISIPAGTGFSAGGNTYISQESVTLPESNFTGGNRCASSTGKASVRIAAQNGGSSSNTSGNTSFAGSGLPSGVTGSGSATGGTDNNVQIVTQSDINSAKAKINTTDDSVKTALKSQLKGDNYYALDVTYTAGTPSASNSVEAGDTANSVTVTATVTYTMFGVKQSDLESLVEEAINEQIDESKQSILDNGINKANFNVTSSSQTGAELTMAVVATAGPELDITTIKQQAAGKKAADVKADLTSNPDVTDVQVKLSPFWVSSVPKKDGKIKVDIAKPSVSSSSESTSADDGN